MPLRYTAPQQVLLFWLTTCVASNVGSFLEEHGTKVVAIFSPSARDIHSVASRDSLEGRRRQNTGTECI